MSKGFFLPIAIVASLIATGFVGSADFDQVTAAPKDGEDVVVMETSAGRIVVMFFPEAAPIHVANFKDLAGKGFYNGVRFHRCINDFMIQGGDPNSKDLSKAPYWGTGGNMDSIGREINVPAEFGDKVKHLRGVLSMARSQDPNSASSQFFIMHGTADSLDGSYSAFGKVVLGMDTVDKIVKTGSTERADNGKVKPEDAIVIQSASVVKWPLKEGVR